MFFLFSFFYTYAQQKINTQGLVFFNDKAYTQNSDKPYTGQVFSLFKSNGKHRLEGVYINGLKDGEFKTFHDIPYYLESIENYKEGQKHGKCIYYIYHAARTNPVSISEISNYINGKLCGVQTNYFSENGIKSFEGEFVNDIPMKLHREWYLSGKLLTEYDHYKSNKTNGNNVKIESIKEYFPDGSVMSKYEKLDSNKFQQIDYYPNGNLMHKHTFIEENPEDNHMKCGNKNHFGGSITNEDFENYVIKQHSLNCNSTSFLGNTTHMVGECISYFENQNIDTRIRFFYPAYGKINIVFESKKINTEEVEYYLEKYDKNKNLVYKAARLKSGGLINESNNLNRIQLLDSNIDSVKKYEKSNADSENKLVAKIEVDASYSSGQSGWNAYLSNNIDGHIPTENGAPVGTYTVIVRFIIEKDGSVSNVIPETNFGFGMEYELVSIIKKSGSWTPALQNGNPVIAYKRQSLTFTVKE